MSLGLLDGHHERSSRHGVAQAFEITFHPARREFLLDMNLHSS